MADRWIDRRLHVQPRWTRRRPADRRLDLCRVVLVLFRSAQGATWCFVPMNFAPTLAAETQLERFWREMKEGLHFLRDRRAVILLGASWALFLGAMITGVVVTPSLSERIFHAGAVGYGWLNAGWGTGAFLSALYAPRLSPAWAAGGRSPFRWRCSRCVWFPLLSRAGLFSECACYFLMGSARGVGGVAMNTSLMEMVPPFDGTGAEYFLFCGHVPATCARRQCRSGCAQGQPGGCFRNFGMCLWTGLRGFKHSRGGCDASE